MKFTSIKRNGSRRFVGNAPFDVKYIKDIEIIEDNSIIFCYDLYDFQTGFPIDVTKACCSVEITDDNLFMWSTIYYIDDENVSFLRYLNDWGDLECEVAITTDESKKMLLYLLNKALSGKINKVLPS